MKQKSFFILFASLLACSVACNRLPVATPKEEVEYISLSLGVSGDVSPAETKGTETSHLYGINVFCDKNNDGSIDEPYAYGLFDNIEDMRILLIKNLHYKFVCTLIKNGKDLLYFGQFEGNTFNGYAKPFQRNNSASTQLLNEFISSDESNNYDYLSGIGIGTATVKIASGEYEEKTMPSLERYYGEVTDYTATSTGTKETVVIPLKKTVFGLRLIIEPVPEGTLSASSGSLLNGSVSAGNAYDSGTRIFSFQDVRECWLQDEYSISSVAKWNFSSSIFSQWDQSGTRSLSLKRNVLTTVTISCTPDNSSGIFSVNEEMIGENGIYVFVNGDGMIEVGVKPEPED